MNFLRLTLPGTVVACTLAAASMFAGAADVAYPATARKPVVDTYHGVAVTDDYRWLEDDKSPDVKAWVAAQNKLTRTFLDGIAQRPEIAKRAGKLLSAKTVSRFAFQFRRQLFAMKDAPPANQAMLVMLPPDANIAREKVLLDPNVLDKTGRTTIEFYKASYDGKRVLVSLSANGSEVGTAYVYDVANRKRLPDVIPAVSYPTAGGSVEWAPDSHGFYYTRYPQQGERPDADLHFYQTVWFHQLGTPQSADRYVIGKDFPRIAEIELEGSRDGRFMLAKVHNGDGGEIAFHVRDVAGQWTQIAGFTDGVKQMAFGDDGRLYAMTIKDASLGRIIAIPLDRPVLANAVTVVPESNIVAESVTATQSRLYVKYRDGGPSAARMFTLDGKRLADIPTEPVSDIRVGVPLTGDDIMVRTMSYLSPPTWFLFRAAKDQLMPTRLADKPPFNFADASVVRDVAISKDGTKVPINILYRKGLNRNGRNPVLLYAYGAYGISLQPWFDPMNRFWLDYGGVFAVCNARGGGEFGEPWHLAGNLTRKQNTFDDFDACMRYLTEFKYTSADRLAIMGGSAGGLTMGTAITQHPQSMRAVVSQVGSLDPLRSESQPNGEFNTTEFGTVKDPVQFKALYDYSPVLRVKDGVAYPAVLFTTGDNDGRVPPYESRKMTARLQAATSSKNPILLRTEANAGHGMGTSLSLRIEEAADIYAFLIDQLGITGPVPERSTRR
ncbi:MAG: prolyl oligopeptidase family serine peptidase [Betaproteobacteria bacterium]